MFEKLIIIIKNIFQNSMVENNKMDIEGYLLGSAFALLIVLLGWANQITTKKKETKDLEAEFLKKGKIKLTDYKKIIDEKGSTEDSFKALVDFLYSKKTDNASIFEFISSLKKDLNLLDKKYYYRFWILFGLSLSLFITGILAIFIEKKYKVYLLIPNIIIVSLVYINLIRIYNLENRYNKNIHRVMEKL